MLEGPKLGRDLVCTALDASLSCKKGGGRVALGAVGSSASSCRPAR